MNGMNAMITKLVMIIEYNLTAQCRPGRWAIFFYIIENFFGFSIVLKKNSKEGVDELLNICYSD